MEEKKSVIKTSRKKKPESVKVIKQEENSLAEYQGHSLEELKLIRKIEREKNRRFSEKDGLNGLLIKLIILAAFLCIMAVAITISVNSCSPKQNNATSVAMQVESTLTSCQELVTYKYRYRQVDFIKRADALNWSNSYVLLKYSGILRAGIEDLNKCIFEYSEEEKLLKIQTPQIKILGNEISSYEVLDESQKFYNVLTVTETMQELDKRMKELEQEAIASGLLTEAAEHAKFTLEKVFHAAGFERVLVTYPEINIIE